MKEDRQPFTVSVSSATIIRVALWLLAFWFLFSIRRLILAVLISVVIASAIEPAVRWFSRYRVPRTPAVLIVYLLAFALLFSLVPLFFVPVFGDLIKISTTLPEKLSALESLALPDGFFSTIVWPDYFSSFSSGIQNMFTGLSRGFLQTATVIFGSLFSFIMVIVISFYLAVQNDGIGNFLRLVAPTRYEHYAIDLWHRSEKKIGLWMQGQLLLGLLVGVIVYLGLTILRVDYALILALMAAMFELIPVFGPILAAVPAVLIGFTISPTTGLLTAGFYIIMQQFENHLLYPLVVKKIVGVPSLVAILSLVIGAQLAGFMGIILAVPIATILIELLNDFEQQKKLVSENA